MEYLIELAYKEYCRSIWVFGKKNKEDVLVIEWPLWYSVFVKENAVHTVPEDAINITGSYPLIECHLWFEYFYSYIYWQPEAETDFNIMEASLREWHLRALSFMETYDEYKYRERERSERNREDEAIHQSDKK